MENEKINIKCPSCSQVLAIRKPAKPGMYKLTCTKCNHQFNLQLRGVPIKMEDKKPEEEQKPENRKKVKVLGEPKPVSDGKYRIDEPALIKHPYGCICPECKKAIIFMPQQAGAQAVKCDKCSTMIIFKAVDNEEQASAISSPEKENKEKDSEKEAPVTLKGRIKSNKSKGMLSWGNVFCRKKFILPKGNTIIGRKDPDYPSDIEFKDDKMSRRSVTISVTHEDKGWFFKLTVNKAMNPVYVNNSELAQGESVFLRYGSSIQLGKTIILFHEAK